MSQYFTMTTCFRDPDALVEALLAVGRPKEALENYRRYCATGEIVAGDIQRHAQAVPLMDYQGRDSGRVGNIIIRRERVGDLQNDLAFTRKEDGTYAAEICDYAQKCGWNQTWLGRVSQRYAVIMLQKQAKKTHMRMTQTVGADGSIKVKLQKVGA
jgi:hypothetical protein